MLNGEKVAYFDKTFVKFADPPSGLAMSPDAIFQQILIHLPVSSP
jgi:hypothetical protein